jgi:hypothetical protein
MSRKTVLSRVGGSCLALATSFATLPACADDASSSVDSEAGIGVAAVLVSLVYTPAKLLYAVGGGAVAGMAYLASAGDQDVTEPILTPSLRGDYVVTPEHLRGEKPLEFFGRAPEPTDPPAVSSGDGLDSATRMDSAASETGVDDSQGID